MFLLKFHIQICLSTIPCPGSGPPILPKWCEPSRLLTTTLPNLLRTFKINYNLRLFLIVSNRGRMITLCCRSWLRFSCSLLHWLVLLAVVENSKVLFPKVVESYHTLVIKELCGRSGDWHEEQSSRFDHGGTHL